MFEYPFYRMRNMSKFRKACEEKKHVVFGFIGGSITDSRTRNRWSEYVVSQFIAENPEIIVDVENAAIAATGSDYGVFRIDDDILAHPCDVIFVEYAVNDMPLETNIRNFSREGLIRKILKKSQADIVLVYTYREDMLEDMLQKRLPPTIEEFEIIAEHYGISSVFSCCYALNQALCGNLRWEEWLPDGLHPENAGSRYYAKPVVQLLKNALMFDKQVTKNTKALYSDNWENSEIFPLEQVRRSGYWRLYRCVDRPLVKRVLSTTCINSSISLDFYGTGIVLSISFGWMSSDYRWRIDEDEWNVVRPVRPYWLDDYNWIKTQTLATGLTNTKHTLEIETIMPMHDEKSKGTTFEICMIGVLKSI